MAKSKVLHFRVTDNLKSRYETALLENGVSITDHLTHEITRYVNAHERKKKTLQRLVKEKINEQKTAP